MNKEIIQLTEEDKDLLIRAFSHYYECVVWDTMVDRDSNEASEEDYRIRSLTNKLNIRSKFPEDIKSRW